ncbi:MAG: hypothetical protein JO273_07275 [Methylobacteriaceae bacterium]|nr:hypothetical protein [Methylobacteriaceae bacterium]
MAQIPVTTLSPAGSATVYQAASAGGDAFNNPSDERSFVHVKNGSGGTLTVTIAPTQATAVKIPGVGALAPPSRVISIAAGADAMIGPFTAAYMDANNNVNLAYSSATSVTVGAFRLPAQSY